MVLTSHHSWPIDVECIDDPKKPLEEAEVSQQFQEFDKIIEPRRNQLNLAQEIGNHSATTLTSFHQS